MEAITTLARPFEPLSNLSRGTGYVDPLDDDRPGDVVVVTTRRAIGRVALVASEAASRFQREEVNHDAMSWMFAPRELFGGACAIDACLDRDACLRGVLVHGLSLGLDVSPEFVDALTAEDDDEDGTDGDEEGYVESAETGAVRLFTAMIAADDGFETVHAFHASFAVDAAEMAGRLHCRMGAAMADARIVEGFDPSDPLVVALVSNAMADLLSIVAADPSSDLAAGLDVNIEQRFRSG